MTRGVAAASPALRADPCPLGDGGEGTLDALLGALGGGSRTAEVRGPLGEPVAARYAVAAGGTTGFVELAEASGLALVPEDRRDPTRTTTYGTGELIALAAREGCAEVLVSVGGSASCDGGTGIAQALGARFLDARGRLLDAPLTGGDLLRIGRIEPPLDLPAIRVACDVDSPLLGPDGAAAVFGPQKGATPAQVDLLERGLAHLARVCGADPGDLGAPGSGAAGGAAFGLHALCGARLERGIDLVLDAVGFDRRCRGAILVLTGEGRLDAQSRRGKACLGVAARAARHGVPTIAIVGAVGPGGAECVDPSTPGLLAAAISLSERYGQDRSRKETAELIAEVAKEVVEEGTEGQRD